MTEPDIDEILRGGHSRRRWLLLSIAAVAIVAAALVAFFLTRSEDSDIVLEPEQVEATMGQLTTEVELSGSAVSERSATLGFEIAGVVASVSVEKGQAVRQGDTLAMLVDRDAQRRVETAEVQLRQAQLRLDNLLEEPSASAIASAEQAIVSATAQVMSEERALEQLSEPASAADLASAEQAVATALRELSSAEQALAELSDPPSAADLASAEQAVATARREVSSAEQALAELSDPPSASELSSAEQAVANALLQISSAEEELADLLAGPSQAERVDAHSDVTQARVQLSESTTLSEELMDALVESYDDFCERYGGLTGTDAVIRQACVTPLPLTDAQVRALRDSFEDASASYETLGTTLIDANVDFVAADADRESASASLTSAEERLSELLEEISEDDLFQAEQALEVARASNVAAVAHWEDLRAAADSGDVYQAEQALEAAESSHQAAIARLEDLREEADEEDLYQAEQALEAAQSSHQAAVARLDDLRAEADHDDVEQAIASLDSALANLATAQAQYDDLLAGPTDNAIEQQRQDVRLAELALEEARTAVADLALLAPFDGVVEDVSVFPGDNVSTGFAAFTLNTSDRMLIELTVTEEELLELEVGQTGVATFDAIDGVNYPVRVESISRVPNSEQGVVTYDVEARIFTGALTEGAAPQGARGGFAAGGFGGGGFGGGQGGSFPGVVLPEGVTPQQVREALISGSPLPEGVVLPERLLQAVARIRASGGFEQGAGQQSEDAATRPLPAPGMSASVSILTEVREEALLLPTSAVRQLDGRWFVSIPGPAAEGEAVPGFERIFVEIGVSQGDRVEITSGLEAGAIVLVGADNAGIAFTATQQQPSAGPGFGPGPGGFGPGGGGGRP